MRLLGRNESPATTARRIAHNLLDRRLLNSGGSHAGAALDPMNHHSVVRNFGRFGQPFRGARFHYGRGTQ